MLTDSYWKEQEGKVTLSGKSEGITGLGAELLKKAGKGTGADVVFLPTDAKAEELVKDCFDVEHSHNPEGYVIDIDDTITVYADTDGAKLFAVHAILGHNEDGIQKGIRYSYPMVEHRSARVYMPPKKDLDYFKRFVDMLSYLGYNALILEIGGAMEWKRHPEINETWKQYCASINEFNNKCYHGSRVYYRVKNSIHTFNGEGDIYSQEEMKALVAYCRERGIDVIPEIASLTHSEYFLISHPELRECDDEPYASTACPSNPALYDLVFDLYDEAIEVFEPSIIHIGHDEWWVMCVCDRCKDKEAG